MNVPASESELDTDEVGGAGLAEADAETVELGTDLIAGHGAVESTSAFGHLAFRVRSGYGRAVDQRVESVRVPCQECDRELAGDSQ